MDMEGLRTQLDQINRQLLALLNRRAEVVQQVRRIKEKQALDLFIPGREKEMLDLMVAQNRGPFPDDTIRHLFSEIFQASLELMTREGARSLLVARGDDRPEVVIEVRGRAIGRNPVVIAGPCSVESLEQMKQVASHLSELGVGFLRGGAFKPRTSPYSFQGLGAEGVRILEEVGREYDLATVSEVVDIHSLELMAEHVDVLQIGTRNMANYELLKSVALVGKPVLLKRGFAATLDELLRAAEYMAIAGNEQIILCERGIRTFGRETRFTLDLSAVPLLQGLCRLPVIVDVSHSSGRCDVIPAMARASLAAGAKGVMIEVHPTPVTAKSDSQQQLNLDQFSALIANLRPFLTVEDTRVLPASEQRNENS
jgi:3-deoxy-7-phosphoheptulonate synthase/chorismate mutase